MVWNTHIYENTSLSVVLFLTNTNNDPRYLKINVIFVPLRAKHVASESATRSALNQIEMQRKSKEKNVKELSTKAKRKGINYKKKPLNTKLKISKYSCFNPLFFNLKHKKCWWSSLKTCK